MVKEKISEKKGTLCFQTDKNATYQLKGAFADTVKFLEGNQVFDVALWKKFVNLFRVQADGADGWRGEYWGKMMRGACCVLAYTRDEKLYRVLADSVRDLLSVQEESGRISTFHPETEFRSWDMWARKYVLLGLQYFLEVCHDEALTKEVVKAMRRHADYIIERVGALEGQTPIFDTSSIWGTVNSCSILEPMVRLFKLTGDKKYFDFSTYIVSLGFCKDGNLIECALQNKLGPYEYPAVKAYEIMSCFEGLVAYYTVTGESRWKTAALNFGYQVIKNEVSVIGCCGCTHELFDHTTVEQTKLGYQGIMQETCVGVTWMKLAGALLQLSGDSVFADCIEQTFYNNYIGALNTHRKAVKFKEIDIPQVLPFDSYAPLTPDTRGRKVGGYQHLADNTFYGCCACIGAAGVAPIQQKMLTRTEDGFVCNFYLPGNVSTKTPAGYGIEFDYQTAYPYDGRVLLTLRMKRKETFALSLRIPAWAKGTKLVINGSLKADVSEGYFKLENEWKNGDTFELLFPMPLVRVLPPEGAKNQELFAAYRRGPVVMAVDARLANPDERHPIETASDGTVPYEVADCPEIPDRYLALAVKQKSKTAPTLRLVDYASAGKTWDEESRCAAWIYR